MSHASKPTLSVTVAVDDPTVGGSPDATVGFTLTVTQAVAPGSIVISEVAPWSSSNSPLAADWFEVTNTGSSAVDLTGWKMDDNSHSIANAVALNGVTSIAPGEAVIFIETRGPGHRGRRVPEPLVRGEPPARDADRELLGLGRGPEQQRRRGHALRRRRQSGGGRGLRRRADR